MSQKTRIPTDGSQSFGQNPFASLDSTGLPPGPAELAPSASPTPAHARNRGRVEIRRQTAGRGGKTVTVISGFVGIGLPEKEQLAHTLQKSCGVGGTVKEGHIEIQGDKRTEAMRVLAEAGFRPVLAGG